MKRDTVPFTAEVLLMCAIFGSIFALVLSGCGRPASADPVEFIIEQAEAPFAAPSCPCGATCECAALKAKLAEAERENEVNKAIAARLENNANVLAGEIDALKYAEPVPVKVNGRWYKSHEGETVVYDAAGNIWRYVKQPAMKQESTQAPDPYMSPCGPGGCPTPSAGGFGIFGRRR